jgi:hypothetical protein
MPEIGTFGLMSGERKRSVAKWPKPPRLSSTLPTRRRRLKSDQAYFNFSEKLMQGIASYVFGQARTDGNPAKQYDSSLPSGVSVSAAVSRLSGIAFYSRQAKLALLHLNARAVSPLTQAEAQLIARDWKVFEHT